MNKRKEERHHQIQMLNHFLSRKFLGKSWYLCSMGVTVYTKEEGVLRHRNLDAKEAFRTGDGRHQEGSLDSGTEWGAPLYQTP